MLLRLSRVTRKYLAYIVDIVAVTNTTKNIITVTPTSVTNTEYIFNSI